MTEETKVCSKCGETKPITEFRKGCKCKSCRYDTYKIWSDKNRDRLVSYRKERHLGNSEYFNQKAKERYYKNKERRLARRSEYYAENRQDILDKQRQHRRDNPAKEMLMYANSRAKENGLPFDITIEDIVIPEVCPVLGIPLFINGGKPTNNSPSLDKIIPEKGYVRGNIRVISFRANNLKNNATIEEVRKILEYLEQQASHTPQK